MGLIKDNLVPFREEQLKNRKLVLGMLRAEDKLYMSDLGQEHINSHGGIYSLESGKIIQRAILKRFGYQYDDESLKNYRSVIHHYYKSPHDYDKEVMSSVVYLRENRLLYYKTPLPCVGDIYKDVPLTDLKGNVINLSDIIKGSLKKFVILAAYSLN